MLQIYNNLIKTKQVSHIKEQESAINVVSRHLNLLINHNIVGIQWLQKIINLFKKKPQHTCFYIYGGVGQGKTMICNLILEYLPKITMFIHCTELLSILQNKNEKLSQSKIIIIDEFEILDIVAAILIRDYVLQNTKTIFVFTSNKAPNDLYKNGLQRQSFVPFINFINKNALIIKLDIGKDYRKNDAKNKIYSNVDESISAIYDSFLKNIKNRVILKNIIVNGRNIQFKTTCDKKLYIDFDYLCNTAIGSDEYFIICQTFDTIFIGGAYEINYENLDIARRLILFIDIAYLNKNKLIIGFTFDFNLLNKFIKRLPEIARTISRLQEII
jgi:cell division protein ZapE